MAGNSRDASSRRRSGVLSQDSSPREFRTNPFMTLNAITPRPSDAGTVNYHDENCRDDVHRPVDG